MTLAELHARIGAAKESGKIRSWNYVQSTTEGRKTIVCKLCGMLIVGKVLVGPPRILPAAAGRPETIYQEITWGPTPAYAICEITHEDGAKHRTPLCAPCAHQELSPATLEAIYMADLEQLGREAEAEGGPDPWETVLKSADRIPKTHTALSLGDTFGG